MPQGTGVSDTVTRRLGALTAQTSGCAPPPQSAQPDPQGARGCGVHSQERTAGPGGQCPSEPEFTRSTERAMALGEVTVTEQPLSSAIALWTSRPPEQGRWRGKRARGRAVRTPSLPRARPLPMHQENHEGPAGPTPAWQGQPTSCTGDPPLREQ